MNGREKYLINRRSQLKVRVSEQVTPGVNVWNSRMKHLFGVCLLRDHSWIFLSVLHEARDDRTDGHAQQHTESADPGTFHQQGKKKTSALYLNWSILVCGCLGLLQPLRRYLILTSFKNAWRVCRQMCIPTWISSSVLRFLIDSFKIWSNFGAWLCRIVYVDLTAF